LVEITLSIILQVIQTVGILVGILYYVTIMRSNQRNQQQQLETRKTQMFMQLYQSKYDREGLENVFTILNMEWDDMNDYMEKYGIAEHPDIGAMVESQSGYMEGLGILVKEGMVDIEMVYKVAGSRILLLWFKMETMLKGFRDPYWNVPDYAENFEYLANEMIKMRRQKGLPIPYLNYLHPKSTLHKTLNR
jgi:hypothetical protein